MYHALALFSIGVWGFSYAGISVALKGFPPFTLAVLRFLIAYLLLLPFKSPPLPPEERYRARMMGVWGITVHLAAMNWALKFTSPSHVSLIIATVPLMTLVLTRLTRREPLRPAEVGAVALGFAGVYLLLSSGNSRSTLLGDGLAFVAALCWIGYSYYADESRGNPVSVSKETFLFGALTSLPLAVTEWVRGVAPSPALPSLLALLYLSVFCSNLGYLAWFWAVQLGDLRVINAYTYLLPVLGVASDALVLRGEVPLRVWTSAGIVVGSLVLLNAAKRSG